MKVAAFTAGVNVPSARFRIRQLIPRLIMEDILVKEFIAPISTYPPSQHWLRPFWLPASILCRIPQVIKSHEFDITIIQREFVSTFSTLESFTVKPRVFDVDDAIFLNRGGNFSRVIATNSDLIVCGNEFLAENFSRWNKNVKVLPTAVDTEIYRPIITRDDRQKVIGWIGVSANHRYLLEIEPAINAVLRQNKNLVLRIISDLSPGFTTLPLNQVQFLRWDSLSEAKEIQKFDVGIMPLSDGEWERGKCSFKMLQYMSCGVPVVVSPVGMNADILKLGCFGLGAKKITDWEEALVYILSNSKISSDMGIKGRSIVENYYSVDVIAMQLSKILKALI
jgi:glycosyltransferase involved in cell wall biosynthesis